MKNIILFFLLLAFTTSFAQYGKKHAANSHLSLQLPHTTNEFNVKSPSGITPSTSLYQEQLPDFTTTLLNTNSDLTNHFHNMYWVDPTITGNGPLHSTYVYDLRGNIVTSKLSYSFSKRH